MSDQNKKRSTGDYEIGFGKTPEYTRYKKGQSGNPKGRPKREEAVSLAKALPSQSELDEILRTEFDRTITINEGGKPKKRKARELVARAQINNALKGNPMSQQHVIRAIRDLELRDAQRADELAEQEEVKRQKDITVFKYMIAYKKEREAVWAEAEARGAEPDELWPHPDDILLFPKTSTWRIRGPFDEADLAYYNWCRAERDYCFAYRILDMTLNKNRHQSWWNIWTLLWGFFDLKLPLRWQQMDKTAVPFFNLSILTDKGSKRM